MLEWLLKFTGIRKALEALSAHYGHAYREFTDGVYVGTDFELMQLLEEEDREDLARTLTNLLSSSRTAGKAAARIEEYRQAHRTDPAFAGKAGLRPLVESLGKLCKTPGRSGSATAR